MNFKLHRHQDKVIDSMVRFILVLTGVQGGKTTIGAIWLLDKIYKAFMQGKRGDWLIAAPTEKILQQSTLPKFKEFFPEDWGVWREQKKCFELVWGGRIFVRSTEDPEHLEGMTILGAWLDEAGQMKAAVWTYIQARVAVHKGPVLMTTTPYAMNWVYRIIMRQAKAGDKDFELITWASSDNPAFPKDEFERVKKSLPTAIFERRYLGYFTRLEGLVYPDFDEELHVVPPFPIPDNWPWFGGMDFGYTNPSCIIGIVHDKVNKTYYVAEEYYKREASLKELALELNRHPYNRIYGDRQAAHLIAELQQQYGCKNLEPCDNKVEIGIERLTKLIKEGHFKLIRGKCPNLQEELLSYHYPAPNDDKQEVSDTGEQIRKIFWGVGQYSHYIDLQEIDMQSCYNAMYESIIKGKGVRPKDLYYLNWILHRNSEMFGYGRKGMNKSISIPNELL